MIASSNVRHIFVLRPQKVVNKYFEFKKLVGRQGTPELELLALVIALFSPILHETLTYSNFDTNTIVMVVHSNAVNSSQFLSRNVLPTALLIGITF